MSVVAGWLQRLLAQLPGGVWAALAVVVLLWGAVRWHESRLELARREGAAAQASLDRAAFERAAAEAAAVQARLVRELTGRQVAITRETDDAVVRDFADLGRRYDELRLRWASVRAGGADAGGAAAISGAAGIALDAACAAGGWVDFATASAAAEAADEAIVKDDAWIAWAAAQKAAWPEAR